MPETHVILAPTGYASREAGLFVAQLDELSDSMRQVTRDLTPQELAWQPAPGMNTIGMLLAHIAIVEVFWMNLGPLGRPQADCRDVLGIGLDDDGMPIAAGSPPPKELEGKTLAFFDDLLARARKHTVAATQGLKDSDLERRFDRKRRNGAEETLNLRWVLYHVLEHQAGHYGQILLLRHQYRASKESAATASA